MKAKKTGQKEKWLPILRKGETIHSKCGFQFRWTDKEGKRHTIHAPSLEELREKEQQIEQDQRDRLKPEAHNVTINEMYDLWKQLKRGLKDNTFQNYQFMYNQYVAPRFGKQKISTLLDVSILPEEE